MGNINPFNYNISSLLGYFCVSFVSDALHYLMQPNCYQYYHSQTSVRFLDFPQQYYRYVLMKLCRFGTILIKATKIYQIVTFETPFTKNPAVAQ